MKDLESNIKECLSFIKSNILFRENNIKIHFNGGKLEKDYDRVFFTLFSLARAYKNNFIDIDYTENLKTLAKHLYDNEEITLLAKIYYLRFLKILQTDLGSMLKEIEKQDFSNIYSHPVSVYVFLSFFAESEDELKAFPFFDSVKNECLKSYEFFVKSNFRDEPDSYSYYYSEAINFKNIISEDILNTSKKLIANKIDLEIINRAISSSGIAKTAEYFSKTGDLESVDEILDFLKSRKTQGFEFVEPYFKKFNFCFFENDNNTYLSLDTTTHLLNTFLNIYERDN